MLLLRLLGYRDSRSARLPQDSLAANHTESCLSFWREVRRPPQEPLELRDRRKAPPLTARKLR